MSNNKEDRDGGGDEHNASGVRCCDAILLFHLSMYEYTYTHTHKGL